MQEKLVYYDSRFAEFLPLTYPPELEVKETTDTASFASFLDVYLEFDDSGQLSTKIYDKRDHFNFGVRVRLCNRTKAVIIGNIINCGFPSMK
jgi:hypothetical protein